MINRVYFLCLLLFIAIQSSAQEINDSVPKSYDLASPQYKAWKDIEQVWMKNEYGKILKENKLKMTCSGCESIFMDVILVIDPVGKLKYYRYIRSRKCSGELSKKLQERFIKWFLNLNFPAELYNKKFEVRLGTGLKC